jgi:hypothetical protein
MKHRVIMFVAAAIIIVTAVAVVIAQTRPTRQNWEFMEVELSETVTATPVLNKHGAEGWELVNVVSACKLNWISQTSGQATEKCSWYAYFKRPK